MLLFTRFNKFFTIFCVLVLSISLSACSEEKKEQKVLKGVVFTNIETITIKIIENAFYEQLKSKGYDNTKVILEEKNANGDTQRLMRYAREVVEADYDFIVTTGTPATQAVMRTRTRTPLIYMGISNPDVAHVSVRPDADTTGTVLPFPVEKFFGLIHNLTPGTKKYGIVYSGKEENAVKVSEKIIEHLNSKNLKYQILHVSNVEEIEKLAQNFIIENNIELLVVANDSLVQSNMPLLSEIALEENVPAYCVTNIASGSGCLATISGNLEKVGQVTADLLIEFLAGKALEEIPTKFLHDEQDTFINRNVAETFNITIPQNLKNAYPLN